MKLISTFFIAVALLIVGCQPKQTNVNPFFSEYATPHQAPPFGDIDTSHYLPAFERAMADQVIEIQAITEDSEEPTFDNTIAALDNSGALLDKVGNVFFNVRETDNNDQLMAIAREVLPKLTKHRDDISMNMALFSKVKAVYEKRAELNLSASQLRVTEKYFNDFVRNGANLSVEDQEKLKLLNEELSMLQLKFGENQLAETNKNFALVIENETDLAGLPSGVVEAAAETAKSLGHEGKWVFTLQKPSLIPFLQYADNRVMREKLYRGYFMRGNNDNEYDNKAIAIKMATLRAQRAKLLGFETHAQYVIDNNMAKTPEKVIDFLNGLWTPALQVAKKELADMQAIAEAEGADFKLQSWDWWYYAEKLRKQRYDLDEAELLPYFKLDNVRDGMFTVAQNLYGIHFEKRTDIPVYNSEVEVFEVKEANGDHIGLLYMDYHPRESKGPGAWCTSFRESITRNGQRTAPLVSIVCNFTPPTSSAPALLNFDEVQTLFHEFGHALHGLFTTGQYKRTAGVVAHDYVELPSQIMENWSAEPEVLKMYARHYQTGETIPDELIQKIQNSGHFNQGFQTVEYLAAALLDLDWHQLTADVVVDDAITFEQVSMDAIGLIDEIIPRYRTTYFGHIFDGGYSAGYYVYIWAAVLDTDAFDAFVQSGNLFNPELAAKFRQHCLAECGDDEGMVQYVKFRGQEPSLEPLKRKRGLLEATN